VKGKKQRKAAQRPESGDDAFSLQTQESPEDAAAPNKGKGKTKPAGRGKSAGDPQVVSYRHQDKRKNNPQIGLVDSEFEPELPKTTWASTLISIFPLSRKATWPSRAGTTRVRPISPAITQ